MHGDRSDFQRQIDAARRGSLMSWTPPADHHDLERQRKLANRQNSNVTMPQKVVPVCGTPNPDDGGNNAA